MTRSLSAVAILLLIVAVQSDVAAQNVSGGARQPSVASLGIHLGMLTPTQSLPDGTSFDSGFTGGLTGTLWPMRNFGLRTSAMFGKSGGGPMFGETSNAQRGTENPTIGLYSLELAVRYPMSSGRLTWFPYAAGGIGGKQYLWSARSTGTEWDLGFAWVFSGGVDLRLANSPRLGFVLDVSNFRSKYIWHGHFWDEPGVSDMRLTAGFTLNR